MKTHGNNSSKEAFQSFRLALIAAIAGAVLYKWVVVEGLVEPGVISGALALLIYGVVNASCCFFIVRHHPMSIWFVPLILNTLVIAIAVMEPAIFRSSFWLSICGGSLSCIIASIAGAFIGDKTNLSQHPLENA